MTDAELVKAAAERVMGWKVESKRAIGIPGREMWKLSRPGKSSEYYWPDCEGGGGTGYGWNPLNNEADCWMLVDKLVPNHLTVKVEHLGPNDGRWCVSFPHSVRGYEADPDRRRAIVLAAIKATGGAV